MNIVLRPYVHPAPRRPARGLVWWLKAAWLEIQISNAKDAYDRACADYDFEGSWDNVERIRESELTLKALQASRQPEIRKRLS